MDNLFDSEGVVWYGDNYCLLWICEDIVRYYRTLLPKYLYIQPPKTPAHITICRRGWETPDYAKWGLLKDQKLAFRYSGQLYRDETYVWLECWSDDIIALRKELGLPKYRHGFDSFHITIGNRKVHRQEVVE